MGEVATWSMIRSKISSFPAPTSGRGNECLTKSEIISMGGNGVEVSGSYGNQETVVLDNIGAVTWEYVLSVSVSTLSFAGAGGTKSFTVTSTKQKKVNGVNSGSPVSVGYSNSVSGSGFLISGNTVSVGNNASSSSRSGTVTVTQGESGKKVTISLLQAVGARIEIQEGYDIMVPRGETSKKVHVRVTGKTGTVYLKWEIVSSNSNMKNFTPIDNSVMLVTAGQWYNVSCSWSVPNPKEYGSTKIRVSVRDDVSIYTNFGITLDL